MYRRLLACGSESSTPAERFAYRTYSSVSFRFYRNFCVKSVYIAYFTPLVSSDT